MNDAAEDQDSVLVRDDCPECRYPPRPNENVHYYEVEGEYVYGYAVDCPNCGHTYVYAYKGKDGIDLPDKETIVAALEQ